MSDVKTLYQESEELKEQGQLDQAIAKLNEALQIDADHVLSHLALAVLYGRVDQHEKAIEHGERACQLEPSESFNFTALSVTYVRALQASPQNEHLKLKAEEAMERSKMMQGMGGH